MDAAATNPLTRRLTVTASGLSTLAELSGNRAILGISVGDSALRTEGLRPVTVADLDRDLSLLRSLLDGRTVELPPGTPVRLDHAQPAPIYVAATGPRMLELAGRVADGVILMNGVAPELITAAVSRVRAGAASAGRRPDEIAVVVWAACSVSDKAPQSALDAVKYNVARAIMRKIPGMDTGRLGHLIDRVRAEYNYREHGSSTASFAALVPDDLVSEFAFAGTTAEVLAQVTALQSMGVDEIAFALPDATGTLDRSNALDKLSALLPEARADSHSARFESNAEV